VLSNRIFSVPSSGGSSIFFILGEGEKKESRIRPLWTARFESEEKRSAFCGSGANKGKEVALLLFPQGKQKKRLFMIRKKKKGISSAGSHLKKKQEEEGGLLRRKATTSSFLASVKGLGKSRFFNFNRQGGREKCRAQREKKRKKECWPAMRKKKSPSKIGARKEGRARCPARSSGKGEGSWLGAMVKGERRKGSWKESQRTSKGDPPQKRFRQTSEGRTKGLLPSPPSN